MNRKSFLALGLLAFAAVASAAELRIGMIGLDTSHVPAFTDLLNNPQNKAHVPGAKVVAAFKGGSPDIASSRDRVEGFTKTLVDKYNVKLYDTIEEMVKHVDAVFIESVD
ncbi:MAG: gfo/Idh/MocA family oxidoreductase, partial [Verrucomicrobia bacterium]|nr:gfo/Idh/MocA family oxidoreductase [Verrucomicrobiota bacterium]